MTFGTGPFGVFGAGQIAPTVSAERGVVHSSRAIDPDTGDYLQNGDDAGSFAGTTDIRQRVLILTSFVREPVKQDAEFLRTVQNRIRTALAPLTAKPNPAIKLLSVDVQTFTSGTKKTVRYVDLTNGEKTEQDV